MSILETLEWKCCWSQQKYLTDLLMIFSAVTLEQGFQTPAT